MTDDSEFDQAIATGMALSYHAARQADAKALVTPFGERTFRELNARANQLAGFLRANGIGK